MNDRTTIEQTAGDNGPMPAFSHVPHIIYSVESWI